MARKFRLESKREYMAYVSAFINRSQQETKREIEVRDIATGTLYRVIGHGRMADTIELGFEVFAKHGCGIRSRMVDPAQSKKLCADLFAAWLEQFPTVNRDIVGY